MLQAGEVSTTDTVLEVGPGKGVLTEKLLEKAGKVIVVEKDQRLIPFLTEKFALEIKKGKLEIIEADILDLEIEKIISEKSFKLIANIPYYITGQFLRKFLEGQNQPERIVIMVQKEIADRITARDGKENLLSLSVKAYGTPKKIMKVDKENFSPAPKVDSAILAITDISKKFFTEMDSTSSPQANEQRFFDILHAGFAHKRKILISNLKSVTGQNLVGVFQTLQIPEKARAEDLNLIDWLKLTQIL